MNTVRRLPRLAACYLMCSLLTVFVLGMDTYFNMEEYKCAAFFGAFSVGVLLFLLGRAGAGSRSLKRDALLCWGGACALSCIFSQWGALDGDNALWGTNGYYMGTLFLLASLAVWYVLRSAGDRQMARWGIGLFLLAGLLADVLGILNLYGFDPLGKISQLQAFQQGAYFTTIGQMNFVALLLTMWLALAVGTFLFSRRPITAPVNLFRLFCCGMGFWGMVLVDSDSYLLGAFGLLLGVLLLPQFSTRVLQRLSLLGAVFFGAAALGVALTNRFPTARSLPLVSGAGTPWVALTGIFVSGAVFAALRRWHRIHPPKALAQYGRRAALGAVALCCAAVAWGTLSGGGGTLSKYLCFDETWGTNRGACWIALSRIFGSSSPLRKLFGYGACATHRLLMTHSKAWEGISYDLSGFYAAHNEYLELLLSGGLFGLVTWLGFVGAHLKKAVCQAAQDSTVPALTLAIAAYAVEAAVNIRTCMVFPVFMVLLGLLAAALREPQPEEASGRAMAGEVAAVLLAAVLTSLFWQSIGGAILSLC